MGRFGVYTKTPWYSNWLYEWYVGCYPSDTSRLYFVDFERNGLKQQTHLRKDVTPADEDVRNV